MSGAAALLGAAVLAVLWANSPWDGAYRSMWGGHLRGWVNEGLMTLFFLTVGFEIKWELVAGDLRDRRTAALPVIAALGGMAMPAALYLAFTVGTPAVRGWGIPMATDIAFAVGVVSLAARRAPLSLRLFLLALAVVDHIGAILVIALAALQRLDLAPPSVVVILGLAAWAATYRSGVHATIAGVAVGLVAPARAEVDRRLAAVVAFGVLPVFALANAGVTLRAGSFGRVSAAVAVGLVAGKVVGISGASWLAVRSGVARAPERATWPMVASVAAVGGVGFTVSLFVAELAFTAAPARDAAKVGVLVGSAIAAAAGATALRVSTRRHRRDGDG